MNILQIVLALLPLIQGRVASIVPIIEAILPVVGGFATGAASIAVPQFSLFGRKYNGVFTEVQ